MSVKVGGRALAEGEYDLSEKLLVLRDLPTGAFELEIETEIRPEENTSLEGLYKVSSKQSMHMRYSRTAS